MRNLRRLKVRIYAARLIEINEYLDLLLGARLNEKNGMTELHENLLNTMPNNWIKQGYVQGFVCNSITF